ncbi:MAG: DUF5995 family protein [Ilumatobacteraceae bacterium]
MANFDDTIGELGEAIETCRRTKQRAGYFAALYWRTTKAVRARADAGRFENRERMERFASTFAERYLAAYRAWQTNRPMTASWKLAFDTASIRRPVVLQHLVLGMSAHINLDLGVVAAGMGRDMPGGLASMRSDFDLINGVLSDELEGSQANVDRVSPFIGLADHFGLRSDEALCRFTLRIARQGAWRSAEELSNCPADQWDTAIARRDHAVAAFGSSLVHPGGALGLAIAVVRVGELRSVPHVIDVLSA